MSHIHVLAPHIANLIAAGEVVERPASVVKELCENALDAGATEVVVDLRDGGMTRITISDNGAGMDAANLARCILPHATSKIVCDADLLRIATFGFRGEALPSIAAVSRVSITSKTADAPHGSLLVVDAGQAQPVQSCAAVTGTTVVVESLFAQTPARQKFLKTERTEYSHSYELIVRLALANPHVQFVLRHQGKETVRTHTVHDLRGRIAELWDVTVAEQVLPFDEDSAGIRVSGFSGRPHLGRAGSAQTYLAVNGRVVRDRLLMHAVTEAYRTILPKGEYPFCVLSLQLSPDLVDVNVHPAKAEVRFVQPQAIHQLVLHTVRSALQQASSEPLVLGQVCHPEPFATLEGRLREGSRSTWSETPIHVAEPTLPYGVTVPPLPLRSLGQLSKTYLLYELPGGDMIVIDQHAAHEQLGYMQLKTRFEAGDLAVQALLLPVTVELSPKGHAAVLDASALLLKCGLDVADFGGTTIIVKSVPALLKMATVPQLLAEIAQELQASGTAHRLQEALDHVLMTMACHRQVRAGDYLSPDEIQLLAQDIMATPTADRCPHGRPTWVRVRKSEIEKWFARR